MSFQLPEDLSALTSEELEALHADGLAEARAIAELPDDELTDEQIADAETIMAGLEQISAEVDTRAAAAEARNARLAALRDQVTPAENARTEEEEPPAEGDDDDEDDEEAPAEKEAKVPVVAAARSTSIAKVARKAPTVIIHDPEPVKPASATLVAAANVPGYETGSEYTDLNDVADAFMARARAFAGRTDEGWDRYGVAKIKKPQQEFALDERMSVDDQMQLIYEAARESRLPGGSLAASSVKSAGSLTAAGGWCAPSETLYDFCPFEQPTDLISVPEIQINRGGIRWTKGPDFSSLTTNWGFLQTEAQAQAGTAKTCYDVVCPPFSEVRLDAIGFCIKAGLLTRAGYPELISRVLEMGLAAHALKVHATVISRIEAALGTPINYTEANSATGDLLSALELNAQIIRTRYGLPSARTIEVILPTWVKGAIRADLSFRSGVDMLNVSDSQIASYFAARGLAVQFVAAWQSLPTTGATLGQAWPATVRALMYPAGAFVRGTTPVIDLDTVYDSVGLSTNTYTAAFFEEGLLVVNTCYGGAVVDIATACLKGVTGAAALTCA